MNIAIRRKFQTRRLAEDSTRLYGAGFPKSLFKIPVIHTNLNCYAEYSPPLQGAQRPQRGRVGVGVSDIVDKSKAHFSRLLPSPQPSLLLRKQCLSLRELSQSHRERGI